MHCRYHYMITPKETVTGRCDSIRWARTSQYGMAFIRCSFVPPRPSAQLRFSHETGEEVSPIGCALDMGGGRGVWAFPFVEQQRKSLRLCQPPLEARLYAAAEWPTSTAPVMAHYTPAAYMLVDEKEYLQAYEDVLEKYKGNRIFFSHWAFWILVLLSEYLAIRLALNSSVIPATECLTATVCGGDVG